MEKNLDTNIDNDIGNGFVNIYFARRSGLYGGTIDKWCIDLISNMNIVGAVNKRIRIIDPAVLIRERQKEIDKIESNRIKESFIMEKICLPAIDNSDIFVYLLDKNDIKLSPKVEVELDYAIRKYKKIFRIFQGNAGFKLVQMTNENIKHEIIKWCTNNNKDSIGDKIRSEWALKNTDDYLKFYTINLDAARLIIEQFREGIKGSMACIPHFNSAHKTHNYSSIIWCNCPLHQSRHAFYELRDKEFRRTCIYTGVRSVAPGYSKMKLDRFDDYRLRELLMTSRTIHRSMNIFDDNVFHQGIVLRNMAGNVVIGKGGKSVADLRKIVGCIPLIDVDLDGSFFDVKIFRECIRVLDIIREYMDKEWPGVEWRLGFSGNGLYVIFDELIFEKYGFNYGQWTIHWKQKREILERLLRKNRIWKVKIEKKYGWNRYFKVMMTFHLDRDRLAIPLDKDKELDLEWIDYYTNIKNGLERDISKEIIDKAGSLWRL